MLFDTYPLTQELHRYWRKEISKKFPQFAGSDGDYLSIIEYVLNIPQRFYSEQVYCDYSSFLNSMRDNDINTLAYLIKEKESEISLALKYLNEINSLDIHEMLLPEKDINLYLFVDRKILYNYLKLVEGVYATLVYPLAYLVVLGNNKKPDCLRDIFNIVENLKKSQYSYMTDVYHNTIRNGIAHGDVSYRDKRVIFKDSKGNIEELYIPDFIDMFDEMVDSCNAMALSLKMFCLCNQDFFLKANLRIPKQVMLAELKASVNAPRWEIEEVLESGMILGDRSQLMIYVKNNLLAYDNVFYLTFRTAILAEKYASGYDRYFFNLNSKYSLDGWAAFDGNKLKSAREKNDISEYKGALENDIVFFVPGIKLPKIIRFFATLFAIYKINLPLFWKDYRNTFFPNVINKCLLRMHRNGCYSIINGTVVLNDIFDNEYEFVRHNLKKIVRKAIKQIRKEKKFTDLSKYLPIGYMRISIYSDDFRNRKIYRGGLVPELVCTVQLKRLKKIQAPDIMGGKAENKGKYKIVWNSNAKNFDYIKGDI